MKICLLTQNNYNKINSKQIKTISFGEMDGDYYDSPRMTRNQYESKKASINEKYDRERSSYLNDADDLGFSNSVVWQQLKNLEESRYRELRNLESDYNY